MTIAHVFWEGEVTDLQIASMLSYQKNGFDVILWSLSEHDNLPNGIDNRNASEIFEYDILHGLKMFSNLSQHNKYSMYSDFFRFRVLEKYSGWYFDCDTICLKNVKEFEELSAIKSKFVVGRERDDIVLAGTSVLHFNNLDMLGDIINAQNLLLKDCLSENYIFEIGWTDFGPPMLTKIIVYHNLLSDLLPSSYFYKIPSTSANLFYQKARDQVKELLSDSYVAHWWGSNAIYNDHAGDSLIKYLCELGQQ